MKTRDPKYCPRCGRLFSTHEVGKGCPVVDSILERLRAFRDEHGRTWKAALREVWELNQDVDDPLLRRARNVIGPYNLTRVKL